MALVTGGGSGLGAAIVARFRQEGARVGVLEVSTERAAALSAAHGPDVVVHVGDVRSAADNRQAVAATLDAFGRLDTFVGNAGVYDNRAGLADLDDARLGAAFDELFGVNVKGYLLGARAALEPLRQARGSIIFTASVSGLHAGFGGVLYVAAKHAIVGLTRQLAYELAPEVRVNAVAPGYVPTNLQGLASLDQGPSKRSGDDPAARLPLRVAPTADDYTGLYVLLASPRNGSVLTGEVVLADGGIAIWGPGERRAARA